MSRDASTIVPEDMHVDLNIGSSERSGLERIIDATDLRIIIIGKTGTGKSATGNKILGKSIFTSGLSASSITKTCQLGMNTRFNRTITVVDTPGLYDTDMRIEELKKEMVRGMGMTVPGPHVILLTVGIGRFTVEEYESFKHLINLFGLGITSCIILLFTSADVVEYKGLDIKDYVKNCPSLLHEILDLCDNRYMGFNNDLYGTREEQQVKNLIGMVDEVVHRNGGFCKINKIFEEAIWKLLILEDEMQKKVTEEEQRKREFHRHHNQNKLELRIQLANNQMFVKRDWCVTM
ncbi:GTPase IMAP family member 4 [Mytilus coruscus]|uniref:GTPase IMAP family member 4 n=1 Tax=Mytilus coruscus TaxID=42192 RepID=A0A6J8C0W2_MYTCO|nr:GTPase IMAP family member 4 [Mytilus coruscus]